VNSCRHIRSPWPFLFLATHPSQKAVGHEGEMFELGRYQGLTSEAVAKLGGPTLCCRCGGCAVWKAKGMIVVFAQELEVMKLQVEKINDTHNETEQG
jgi:hypothetical protein